VGGDVSREGNNHSVGELHFDDWMWNSRSTR
jgi:hypothetical protein